MEKVVFFAFNGNKMCFQHLLLNVLDYDKKGKATGLVIEGEAVRLVEELETSKHPLYTMAKEKGLILGICQACSAKLGVLEFNRTTGLPILGDMSGHPSMEPYTAQGYAVITL